MQTSKSQLEVKTEEIVSIGFLNEETSLKNYQATTSKSESSKPKSNVSIDKQRYKCDFCHKRFNQSSNLASHRRTHTGEKPYECDVCKKRFCTSSALEIHGRIHNGERPFECEVCKNRFNTSGNLVNHRLIHSGEKRDVCKKSFHTSSAHIHNRKTHIEQYN